MKYYLEITLLNQQIFKTEAFEDKEIVQNECGAIFSFNYYTVGDTTFPVSQIQSITIKELTSDS